MEHAAADLLIRSVVARTSELQSHLPRFRVARGSSLIPLVHFLCQQVRGKAEQFEQELETAHEEDIESYLRSLQELLKVETWIHDLVSKYAEEIDRDDLPVGLLYLVDSIVLGLLGENFDPLIHKHPKRTYSTDSIWHDAQPLLGQCDETYEETRMPVVFNIPAVDPANALLSPILVHETAHTYLRISTLRKDLFDALADDGIETQAQEFKAATGQPWPNRVHDNWMTELVCTASLSSQPDRASCWQSQPSQAYSTQNRLRIPIPS